MQSGGSRDECRSGVLGTKSSVSKQGRQKPDASRLTTADPRFDDAILFRTTRWAENLDATRKFR
jgi:hypothetical protein